MKIQKAWAKIGFRTKKNKKSFQYESSLFLPFLKDALLREFQDEISKLKKRLEEKGGPVGTSGMTGEEMIAEAKRKIQEDKEMAENEKKKIMKEARKKSEELKKQRENQENMHQKLKKMQEKLLMGGVNLHDRTSQQEKVWHKFFG